MHRHLIEIKKNIKIVQYVQTIPQQSLLTKIMDLDGDRRKTSCSWSWVGVWPDDTRSWLQSHFGPWENESFFWRSIEVGKQLLLWVNKRTPQKYRFAYWPTLLNYLFPLTFITTPKRTRLRFWSLFPFSHQSRSFCETWKWH